MDLVTMTGNGPGNQGQITPRLRPIGYGDFWSNANGSIYPETSADNTVRHDSQGYSYKVFHPANTGQSLDSSVFAVSAGSVVTASVWVAGDGGPRAFLTLISSLAANEPSYFQPAGTTYSVETAVSLRPNSTWTKITASMVVPAGHTKARLMLRSYADGSYGASTGTVWWDDSSSSMQVIPPSDVITGEIKMWPDTTAPGGYLLCNGGTFSSTTYPALAALLGDKFGTHSGTTYYLPDFRGRSPIGVGATTNPSVGGNNYSLGQKWGDERIPSHTHGGSGTTNAGSAESQGYGNVPEAYYGQNYGAQLGGGYSGRVMIWNNVQGTTHAHGFAFTTNDHNSTKQASAVGNVHPVIGINFIIKAA